MSKLQTCWKEFSISYLQGAGLTGTGLPLFWEAMKAMGLEVLCFAPLLTDGFDHF